MSFNTPPKFSNEFNEFFITLQKNKKFMYLESNKDNLIIRAKGNLILNLFKIFSKPFQDILSVQTYESPNYE